MQQLTVMVTLCVSKKSLYVIVPTAHFVCTLCCDKFAVYMTSDCGPVGGGGRGGGALGQGVGGGREGCNEEVYNLFRSHLQMKLQTLYLLLLKN